MDGIVYNIQRMSTKDGPGLRTTVFLKGCPLHCPWCSNPESQSFKPQLMFFSNLCVGCGACERICPNGAVVKIGDVYNRDRSVCTDCGLCVESCPSKAREMSGKRMTVEEVMRVVDSDSLFYDNSGGGVTLSGGEVLAQAAFALDLMAACKRYGIHLALETSGFGKREDLLALADAADCLFYDVKHTDDDVHRELTGQGSGLILDNLDAVLDRAAGKLTVRLPLIPGLNDDEGHLENFARTIKALGRVQAVELLPYHRLGKNKYALLGRAYALESLGPMSKEDLARRAAFVAERLGGTKVLF